MRRLIVSKVSGPLLQHCAQASIVFSRETSLLFLGLFEYMNVYLMRRKTHFVERKLPSTGEDSRNACSMLSTSHLLAVYKMLWIASSTDIIFPHTVVYTP